MDWTSRFVAGWAWRARRREKVVSHEAVFKGSELRKARPHEVPRKTEWLRSAIATLTRSH